MDYNRTKGGVDTIDQMCGNFSVSRRSTRWPMTLFFGLLNLAGINALVLYNLSNRDSPHKYRRVFLKSLALSLVKDHLNDRMKQNLPPSLKNIISRHVQDSQVKEV